MNRNENHWAWGLGCLCAALLACSSTAPTDNPPDAATPSQSDVTDEGSLFPDIRPRTAPDVFGETGGEGVGEESDIVIASDTIEPLDVSGPQDVEETDASDTAIQEDTPAPAGDVVEDVVEPDTQEFSAEEFNAVCDLAFLEEELLAVLDFGANSTMSCPFGEEDNLEASYNDATARLEIPLEIPLPPNAFVCGLEISIEENSYTVNNGLVLRIGDVILVSNSWNLIQDLPVVPGAISGVDLHRYDWEAVKGKNYLPKTPEAAYCLDEVGVAQGSAACIKGASWANPLGWFKFTSKPEVSGDLAYQMLLEEAPVVTATLIGDQSPNDCTHSGFIAFLNVKYVDLTTK